MRGPGRWRLISIGGLGSDGDMTTVSLLDERKGERRMCRVVRVTLWSGETMPVLKGSSATAPLLSAPKRSSVTVYLVVRTRPGSCLTSTSPARRICVFALAAIFDRVGQVRSCQK